MRRRIAAGLKSLLTARRVLHIALWFLGGILAGFGSGVLRPHRVTWVDRDRSEVQNGLRGARPQPPRPRGADGVQVGVGHQADVGDLPAERGQTIGQAG